MAANEGLKPLVDGEAPVDPNVRIPDHVTQASAAADAIHERFYPRNPETPPAPKKEDIQQPAQQVQDPAVQQQVQDPPVQQQVQDPPRHREPAPGPEDENDQTWKHRFLSMQGRYNAVARNQAAMEEQMRLLGEELVRTQNLVQAAPAASQASSDTHHNNLITDEDRQNYGDELLDVVTRAARGAVSPELERLQRENASLTQRVQNTGKRELFATLDTQLPNWRGINQSPQFVQWLRLRNVYTGEVRQKMLNAAVAGADAPKAIQLFKDFLTEAQATGQLAPAAQTEQQVQNPAPREPALNLEALAAPGRARPASGDSQVPSEKPTYSRADISKLYDDKRRGLYAGREAAFAATEADLTAAQREGRIRG